MEENEPTASTDKGSSLKLSELARFEWLMLAVMGLGAAGVGGIGLYSSYGNVTAYMASKGFEHPELVPIAVDIAIPVFSLAYLLLIRLDMQLSWVRWLAHSLVAVTIYLNVTSTDELGAQVGHAALPTLWVAFTEVVAHFYRVQIGRAKGTHTDPIPFDRWFLAPFATFRLWRQMRLWQVTSYQAVLDMERVRVRAVTALRDEYGWAWRFKMPLEYKAELRLGELTADQVRGLAPLAEVTVERHHEATEEEPQQLTDGASIPAQRELENHDEQAALPVGEQTVHFPEGDSPESVPAPSLSDTEVPADTLLIETNDEREQRQEKERQQRKVDNYNAAVQVVLEYIEQNRPIAGPRLAEDERIPVGARTVQRYLNRMVDEGVISEDAVNR